MDYNSLSLPANWGTYKPSSVSVNLENSGAYMAQKPPSVNELTEMQKKLSIFC